MEELLLIIDKIGIIDADLKKLINRQIEIPYVDDYKNLSDYWCPHPPCFIPLFLGYGASYKGVIHHFFSDTKDTFTEYFLEQGFISEIARNSKQWVTLIVLKMIMSKDGLNDEIINFCKQVNYTEYEEIDQFTLDYGDALGEFKNLIHLKENTPSRYIKNISHYNGDFPSTLSELNPSQIATASIFEIASPEKLGDIHSLPLWLDSTVDKQKLFRDYLNKNMLKEAWFALNSKGWKLKDAANALEEIANKTDDELFYLVAKNWINGWNRSNNQEGIY
jgi:hypothetical protein